MLPVQGRAEWVRVPLPPRVEYLAGLTAGREYLFASMRDSSGTFLGLFRTPLENPGEWQSLGLQGFVLLSIIVGGEGDSHILVEGSRETKIFGSTDGGQTWIPRDEGIEDDGRWVRVMGWNGAFPGRVYASVRGNTSGAWIYRSTDFGGSWSKWTLCESCIVEFPLFAIPQDGGLLAYTLEETGYWTAYRQKTTDGGANWFMLDDYGAYFGSGHVDLDLSTDRRDLFATPWDSWGCRWWRDDGDPEFILPPLKYCGGMIGAETPVWAPGILFAAGADPDTLPVVVFAEFPYTEWTVVQDGLPETPSDPCDTGYGGPRYQFEAVPHLPVLFFSIWGQGLWMRDMRDVVGMAEPATPGRSGISLLLPWPNPASGEVIFRAQGANGLPLKVEVFDAQGRSVRRWITTPHGPEGVFVWDGRGADGRAMAPGVYYIKVETPRGTATRGFTILR